VLRFLKSRLTRHPSWVLIKRHLEIQALPPRCGRTRLEIDRSRIPPDEQQQLLDIEMPCVACGQMIHPVKKRVGWRTLYVHVTCDADVNKGCSRSKAARREIDAIVVALWQG